MTEPLVAAIMLTRDRPEMAARAVRCFREQTYQNKALLIWDTSSEMNPDKRLNVRELRPDVQHCFYGPQEYTIGELRNHAIKYGTSEVIVTLANNKQLTGPADIFIHWDDDDYSHPNRISEQVALLQSSGAEVVGYSDCLFWREYWDPESGENGTQYEEAWLYTGGPHFPALGTSLCYWRKTWERVPFPERMSEREQNPRGVGEDKLWLREVKCLAVPSLMQKPEDGIHVSDHNIPRMIASIHGANTSGSYDLEELVKRGTKDWKRVPEWDAYCRKEMAL